MVSRRSILAVSVPALLAATAGCSAISGPGVEFASTPATVSARARSGTGYEAAGIEDVIVTRTYSVFGQERTVEVTNRAARYERRLDLPVLPAQRVAAFVAFTSPKIELLGRSFNPIAGMSNRELLELVQERYTELTVGDQVGSHGATMLGRPTTIEKYEGSGTLAGVQIGTFVHVARVEHGSDFVIALAIYPDQLGSEDATVARLVEGIEHGG